MKKEIDIQKEILDYLWRQDIFCWRNNSVGLFDPIRGIVRKPNKYQLLGVSDILGSYKGKPLAIEVKSATGKLSENQVKFLDKAISEGWIAFTARSVEDVEAKFNQFEKIDE